MFDNCTIERFKSIPTPFYFYDVDLLRQTLELFKQCSQKYGIKCHYAVKANANEKILKIVSSYGLGADCVSGQEVKIAAANGFKNEEIVFAGVGKSDKEILDALKSNIFCFNCESIEEIEVIESICAKVNKRADICLRINPDIDAHTHKYITTGRKEDKFGISSWMFEKCAATIHHSSHLNLIGLHFHVGSQILDMSVFELTCKRAKELECWFIDKGFDIKHINLGGGLGVDYQNPDENPVPQVEELFKTIHDHFEPRPGQTVHIEPGRSIVAQCGSLISRVLYVKHGQRKKFAILDAGMNDLIRPALYGAYHDIQNLTSSGRMMRYDVVGPVCESSDTWGKNRKMNVAQRGDVVAIRTAGAYGQVMAMRYNQKPFAKEVYSDELNEK